MLEGTIECLVKRVTTTSTIVKRFLIIMADATAVLAAGFVLLAYTAWFVLALFALVVMGILTFLVFRNTDLEYEYCYFEGEMTVDKVMGKATRKRIGVFDFTKMDLMAPDNSPRLHNAMNKKTLDYSSANPEDKTYCAVVMNAKTNEQVALKFTPNEDLIAAIKRIAPRSVYED